MYKTYVFHLSLSFFHLWQYPKVLIELPIHIQFLTVNCQYWKWIDANCAIHLSTFISSPVVTLLFLYKSNHAVHALMTFQPLVLFFNFFTTTCFWARSSSFFFILGAVWSLYIIPFTFYEQIMSNHTTWQPLLYIHVTIYNLIVHKTGSS